MAEILQIRLDEGPAERFVEDIRGYCSLSRSCFLSLNLYLKLHRVFSPSLTHVNISVLQGFFQHTWAWCLLAKRNGTFQIPSPACSSLKCSRRAGHVTFASRTNTDGHQRGRRPRVWAGVYVARCTCALASLCTEVSWSLPQLSLSTSWSKPPPLPLILVAQ